MSSYALRSTKRLLLASILLALTSLPATHAQPQTLTFEKATALPGVEGRIDHMAFDVRGGRLFICALGNNSLEVVDLRKAARVHSISGLGAPQGVAYVPELDRVVVANDNGGVCTFYDGKAYQPLAHVKLENDADNVRYDDATRNVYVGFGAGGIAVIGAADAKLISSIKLPAHPESFQLEKNGSRMFVNLPNARQVSVVDRREGKVTASWKTDLAFANFPMALDEASHRLFVGCRMPARLLVLNTDSGEIVSKIEIDGDTDDLFYDSKRRCVYAICGAGTIDVIAQRDVNSYERTATVETAAGARTGMFVPELDTLFVGVPHRGSQQAEVRAYHVQ